MIFETTMHPGDNGKRIWNETGEFRGVRIGSGEGFWIAGDTEMVIDQEPLDTLTDLITRQSANVLMWEKD
jgi:hypothetical protein